MAKNMEIKNIKRIVSIIILLLIIGVLIIVYINIAPNEIDKMDISVSENTVSDINSDYPINNSIKDAVNNEYVENMNMPYIYSKDIGVKINSYVVTDDKIDIVFDFDFNKNTIPENKLNIAMTIYDENKNIYYFWDTPYNTLRNNLYIKKYYKTQGLSNDKYINASQGMFTLYQSKNRYIGELTLDSIEKYPNAKKLYINIYDIGYNEGINDKYKSLFNNVNWSFEINIPEKFYNRKSIKYELKEENQIADFVLDELNISETRATLTYKTSKNTPLSINIVDSNNKNYPLKGTVSLNENDDVMCKYVGKYELNKYLVTDKLYIYIKEYDKMLELKKQEVD